MSGRLEGRCGVRSAFALNRTSVCAILLSAMLVLTNCGGGGGGGGARVQPQAAVMPETQQPQQPPPACPPGQVGTPPNCTTPPPPPPPTSATTSGRPRTAPLHHRLLPVRRVTSRDAPELRHSTTATAAYLSAGTSPPPNHLHHRLLRRKSASRSTTGLAPQSEISIPRRRRLPGITALRTLQEPVGSGDHRRRFGLRLRQPAKG